MLILISIAAILNAFSLGLNFKESFLEGSNYNFWTFIVQALSEITLIVAIVYYIQGLT